jgi:hypothetical protein
MLAAGLVQARVLRSWLGPGVQARVLRLSTSPGHRRVKRPGDGDLFRPEDVHKFSRQDGVEGDFSLIYREATSFKTHKTLQVVGCLTPVFPAYAGWCFWPDTLLFGSLLGPGLLAAWWTLLSAYNLRMFYQVPRRLYFSPTQGTYLVILNRLLPWGRPVSYAFGPEDLKQVCCNCCNCRAS